MRLLCIVIALKFLPVSFSLKGEVSPNNNGSGVYKANLETQQQNCEQIWIPLWTELCQNDQENNSPLTLYIHFHIFVWFFWDINIVRQIIKFNHKWVHSHLVGVTLIYALFVQMLQRLFHILFWECPVTQRFLGEFQRYVLKDGVPLTFNNLIFGIPNGNFSTLNSVIL